VKGICGKPKVKCGECPNQKFIPPDKSVMAKHLRGDDGRTGNFVVGVYPLLSGDTCWFLAADFDKASWADDANALLETCQMKGVPAGLERSRSGNGGHVWIFFSEPVSARLARQLGSVLITETMERRPEIGFASYDRLFPNQDIMPLGGFGNLIALPLQGAARKARNSVFVDTDMRPIGDQWAYLSSLPRMLAAAVGDLVVDECHHLSAASFVLVARRSKARYVTGLSATVARKDGHHPIIFMQCGPVRHQVSARSQAAESGIHHRARERHTRFRLPEALAMTERPSMPAIYAALAEDEARDDLIFDDVLKSLEAKRSPIVLTERKDHLINAALRCRRLAGRAGRVGQKTGNARFCEEVRAATIASSCLRSVAETVNDIPVRIPETSHIDLAKGIPKQSLVNGPIH
jgi:hypothetical protein